MQGTTDDRNSSAVQWCFAAFLFGAVTYLFILYAWICDDAFVTFRYLDNLFAGHGLRFNINERVQGFTSPLWLFLNIPAYLVLQEPLYAACLVSYAVVIAAWALLFLMNKGSLLNFALAFVLPIFFSYSFLTYSTSGLETPLIFLLIVMTWFYIDQEIATGSGSRILGVTFCMSLLALNRLDSIIFFVPIYTWLLIERIRSKRVKLRSIVLGGLPIIAWLSFSLFYFGFLLPNTYYTKLATGIPRISYFEQGLSYFADLSQRDQPGFYMIVLFFVVYLSLIGFRLSGFKRKGREIVVNIDLLILGSGGLLFFLYVLYIGGGFMSGRFVTPLIIFGLLFITKVTGEVLVNARQKELAYGAILVTCFLSYMFPISESNPVLNRMNGIADERAFYAEKNSLVNFWQAPEEDKYHDWLKEGEALKWISNEQAADERIVEVAGVYSCMKAYAAGPRVFVIMGMALWDPLLARLPIRDANHWRIGHFERVIPRGYAEVMRDEDLGLLDPDLAAYYRPLKQIISGPLFSLSRIGEILKFNVGYYDQYRKRYLANHQRIPTLID